MNANFPRSSENGLQPISMFESSKGAVWPEVATGRKRSFEAVSPMVLTLTPSMAMAVLPFPATFCRAILRVL